MSIPIESDPRYQIEREINYRLYKVSQPSVGQSQVMESKSNQDTQEPQRTDRQETK